MSVVTALAFGSDGNGKASLNPRILARCGNSAIGYRIRPSELGPGPHKNAAESLEMKCPKCGIGRPVRLVYGLPGPELLARAAQGLIALGGCCFGERSPDWVCLDCKHHWQDSEAVRRRRWLEQWDKHLQAEAAKRERELALMVTAPCIDPHKPRFEQFFRFVCPSCGHSEEVGLWFTTKTCTACNMMFRIKRNRAMSLDVIKSD
jgi:hypothetical protein